MAERVANHSGITCAVHGRTLAAEPSNAKEAAAHTPEQPSPPPHSYVPHKIVAAAWYMYSYRYSFDELPSSRSGA